MILGILLKYDHMILGILLKYDQLDLGQSSLYSHTEHWIQAA